MTFGGGLTGAPLSAVLVRRIGQRPTVFAGVAFVGLGLLPIAFTGIDTPVLLVAALLVLQGIGQGLLVVAYTDIVTATLPPRDRGVAGSLSLLTRTLGTVSGASVLTALQAYGSEGFAGAAGFLAGYQFAFMVAGGGLLAALLLSCLWPRVWFAR
jgi:MFS family permease